MTWFVYGLTDPVSSEVRYIGFTTQSLNARYNQHLYRSKTGSTHLYCWWRKCGPPNIVVLDSGSTHWRHGLRREKAIINDFRQRGARLTNLTDGGDGTPGLFVSDATRAKLSKAKAGKPHSPEHVANQAKSLRGRKHSPEHRAAIVEGIKRAGGRITMNRQITIQEIANIRATFTGQYGELSALSRATGWSIPTIQRALNKTLWTIPPDVVGHRISINVHDPHDPHSNGARKIDFATARQMTSDYRAGARVADIARRYGLSWTQTKRIVDGECWQNAPHR